MLMVKEKIGGEPESPPLPLNIAGVPVVPFESYEQALGCIEEAIVSDRKMFWVAVNPQKCYRAWYDPDLLDVLKKADVGICDGVGISIAAMILHGRRLRRCTGCDLFFRLLPRAQERGWRVFLLGASPESNSYACSKLRQTYPGLRIVGSQDGFFQDSQMVVEQINASGADLLFVAMGSPTQEYWILRHRQEINAAFCMGVGGSFDVASGTTRRAPRLFRVTGTEWLFQLMTEPRKRWKRQKVYVPFMLRVITGRLSGSRRPMEWAVACDGNNRTMSLEEKEGERVIKGGADPVP